MGNAGFISSTVGLQLSARPRYALFFLTYITLATKLSISTSLNPPTSSSQDAPERKQRMPIQSEEVLLQMFVALEMEVWVLRAALFRVYIG